jgi:hypothetical protein
LSKNLPSQSLVTETADCEADYVTLNIIVIETSGSCLSFMSMFLHIDIICKWSADIPTPPSKQARQWADVFAKTCQEVAMDAYDNLQMLINIEIVV